jgi:surfeit locus 1 family protein
MQARGVILFTAFSAAALALLVGLGLWQLQRLEWKQGLIAQIEQRAHAEPISLADGIARTNAGEDVSYLRVRVEGRFDNAKERYLYALSDGTPGWHVITPLTTSEGQVVLIDRGFVPNAFKEPSSRTQGEINDTVTVTGLARQPETRGLFVSDNEPAENRNFPIHVRRRHRSRHRAFHP